LRLAVGVILNLVISVNPFLAIILLRVTPSANRNTYSIAFSFFVLTQGRGAAHLNPGLGNRNSYRVAKDKRAGKSTDAGTHSTVTYSKSIVDGTPTTATLKEHKTSIFP
jgi:hypothetical protein